MVEPGRAETLAEAPTSLSEVTLDVHGLQARIGGDWPEVIDDLARVFAWLRAAPVADRPAVGVTIRQARPDFDSFGDLDAAFVTPRNVVYQDGQTTVVDYSGRAVSILDRRRDQTTVVGENADLVHEAAYLYLLSRSGEHLDAQGLVRLHGLGLSGRAGATVVMLPSGGGKSTLALRALHDDRCRLLSEDSPLINRHGWVHPFPLRIGVNETDAALLPERHVRRLERMEFHPKLVLELEAFADRIDPCPRPLRHLVIGSRTLGRTPRLEPLGQLRAINPLLREAVIGVGIYQGMEFVLQRGLRDVTGKLGIAATRSMCAAAALARARVWRFRIGRDHDRNWAALRPLLDL
jgi:hypothetical protein